MVYATIPSDFAEQLIAMTSSSPTIFTPSAIYGSGGVAVIGFVAYIGTKTLLHKNAHWKDKATFIWLVRVER
jgi:hypothetical protein